MTMPASDYNLYPPASPLVPLPVGVEWEYGEASECQLEPKGGEGIVNINPILDINLFLTT
jgi:hypothetical protein